MMTHTRSINAALTACLLSLLLPATLRGAIYAEVRHSGGSKSESDNGHFGPTVNASLPTFHSEQDFPQGVGKPLHVDLYTQPQAQASQSGLVATSKVLVNAEASGDSWGASTPAARASGEAMAIITDNAHIPEWGRAGQSGTWVARIKYSARVSETAQEGFTGAGPRRIAAAFAGFSFLDSLIWEDESGSEFIGIPIVFGQDIGVTLRAESALDYWASTGMGSSGPVTFSKGSGHANVSIAWGGTSHILDEDGLIIKFNNANRSMAASDAMDELITSAGGYDYYREYDLDTTPLPEPGAVTAVVVGGLALLRRRPRRSRLTSSARAPRPESPARSAA